MTSTLNQTINDVGSAQRLARARLGTAVVFVLLGIVQGTLASRMPALKFQAGLDDGLLGLALLGVPVGSLLAVQVTGRLITRWGSSPITTIGALLLSASVVAPAFAGGFVTLLLSLILVGVGMGFTDTAMNAHAVTVERAYARPIMSSFHGFASLGALLGALGGGGAARLDVGTQLHFPAMAAGGLAATLAVRLLLLPGSSDAHRPTSATSGSHRAPWSRILVMLSGIALLAWMAEHAIADWSAVYLRDHLGATSSVATYGFILFALSMVVTRFLADRVTARIGPRQVLRWGGLIAGVGLATGLLTDSVIGSTIGCGLVGIGMAGIVPIVFTAAGNLPGVASGAAVNKVAGVAYTGSLIGPPLIGLTADATTLKLALLLVAAAAILIGLVGPRALRRS